jgi:hypothetical protein
VVNLFSPSRVLEWDAASRGPLPRQSFELALWFADASPLAGDLDTLVAIRNALGRDAPLVVVGANERLARVCEHVETAGLSRFSTRHLTPLVGVLLLRR